MKNYKFASLILIISGVIILTSTLFYLFSPSYPSIEISPNDISLEYSFTEELFDFFRITIIIYSIFLLKGFVKKIKFEKSVDSTFFLNLVLFITIFISSLIALSHAVSVYNQGFNISNLGSNVIGSFILMITSFVSSFLLDIGLIVLGTRLRKHYKSHSKLSIIGLGYIVYGSYMLIESLILSSDNMYSPLITCALIIYTGIILRNHQDFVPVLLDDEPDNEYNDLNKKLYNQENSNNEINQELPEIKQNTLRNDLENPLESPFLIEDDENYPKALEYFNNLSDYEVNRLWHKLEVNSSNERQVILKHILDHKLYDQSRFFPS